MISVNENIVDFHNLFKKEYNLQKLLHDLGNPQSSVATINVVGTNGKGSTSNYLSHVFQAKYEKVGLFISPAFLYHNERIQINNVPIADDELRALIAESKDQINKYELTFFEVWTLLAIKYFIRHNVTFAIVEAGIGGRFDCTNLFPNQMAVVLTSVGFDHTEILGSTIREIIWQKLGIAKIDVPVFVAANNKQYESEIFDVLPHHPILFADLDTSSFGYQQINYGLAKLVASYFGVAPATDVIAPPLGRFSILQLNPYLIIDGCHNVSGVKEMIKMARDFDCEFTILFGASFSKKHDEMIELLQANFSHVYLTQFAHFKAWTIDEKYAALKIDDWQKFLTENNQKNIIVCGSLYFVPLVYDWYRKRGGK